MGESVRLTRCNKILQISVLILLRVPTFLALNTVCVKGYTLAVMDYVSRHFVLMSKKTRGVRIKRCSSFGTEKESSYKQRSLSDHEFVFVCQNPH